MLFISPKIIQIYPANYGYEVRVFIKGKEGVFKITKKGQNSEWFQNFQVLVFQPAYSSSLSLFAYAGQRWKSVSKSEYAILYQNEHVEFGEIFSKYTEPRGVLYIWNRKSKKKGGPNKIRQHYP